MYFLFHTCNSSGGFWDECFQQSVGLFRTDATVLGCYFHLCQIVIRKVNEIGLKTQYESNDEVRSYTSADFPCLLSFRQTTCRKRSQPKKTIDHLDELTLFIEQIYIRGCRRRMLNLVYVSNFMQCNRETINKIKNDCQFWSHALFSAVMSYNRAKFD